MLWTGLYVSSSSVFRGAQYMSVISPLFIYLLISRLSGKVANSNENLEGLKNIHFDHMNINCPRHVELEKKTFWSFNNIFSCKEAALEAQFSV